MKFSDRVRAFNKKIKEEHRRNATRVAMAVFQGVTSRSPVDKGKFRMSWTLSEGQPATQPTVGSGLGGATSGSPGPARSPRISGNVPFFPTFYVSNAMPYGPALEAGSSDQAPGGMVDLTVAEVESRFGL